MALKPCRECKKKVSTEALTCPICGVPNPTSQSKFKNTKFKGAIEVKNNKTTSSLGIETLGGVFSNVIKKGSSLPISKTKVYSTAEDNQPTVLLTILTGNSEIASNNKFLADVELVDIKLAPRGVPEILVNFFIDKDGSISISAVDGKTKKGQKIKIKKGGKIASSSVSDLEIPTTEDSYLKTPIAEDKEVSKSTTSWERFMDGTLDLKTAFWGYGFFGSIVIGVVCGFLAEAVGSFFIIVYIITVVVLILGLWQCASNYKKQMAQKKESELWGVLTHIYCVVAALGLANFIKDFI